MCLDKIPALLQVRAKKEIQMPSICSRYFQSECGIPLGAASWSYTPNQNGCNFSEIPYEESQFMWSL